MGYDTPSPQKQPIKVMRDVSAKFSDIASPEAIEYYFKLLYTVSGDDLDSTGILTMLEKGVSQSSFPFKDIAGLFKLIEDGARGIVIPDGKGGAEAIERIRAGNRSRESLREAALHTVSVYAHTIEEFRKAGIIEPLDEELYALTDSRSYTESMGLSIKVEMGFGLEA